MEFVNLFKANAVLPGPSFDITTWNAYIIYVGKYRKTGVPHHLRILVTEQQKRGGPEHEADSDPVFVVDTLS